MTVRELLALFNCLGILGSFVCALLLPVSQVFVFFVRQVDGCPMSDVFSAYLFLNV